MKEKKKMLPVLLALLLFLVILVFTLPGFRFFKEKDEYAIVVLGDSIMGNVRDNTSIPAKLEQALGVKVYNGAFGGTCASRTNEAMEASFVSDNLCLSALADAIANQDFGVLHSSVAYGMKYKEINRQVLPYFEESVNQLENLDFKKTEILVLAYGTNDYTKAVKLDNPEDSYDQSTFGGSLRHSIELLQKTYPDMQIVIVTPIYCILFSQESSYDCTEKDFGSGYLEDYVQLLLQIGREYDLPVIDNFHDSGIGPENWKKYLEDGMHPNEDGRELLAAQMAAELRFFVKIEGGKTAD